MEIEKLEDVSEKIKGISPDSLSVINPGLINRFGLDPLTSKPLFRVVWSEGLVEKRSGEFSEFHGELFLRKTIGTMEVKKYNYITERFVLERYYGYQGEEVKDGDGYEPVYVFQTGANRGNLFLPPLLEMAIVAALNSLIQKPKKNIKMVISEEEAYYENKRAKMLDYLEQDRVTNLSRQFRYGEALTMPGVSDGSLPVSPNLREKE